PPNSRGGSVPCAENFATETHRGFFRHFVPLNLGSGFPIFIDSSSGCARIRANGLSCLLSALCSAVFVEGPESGVLSHHHRPIASATPDRRIRDGPSPCI